MTAPYRSDEKAREMLLESLEVENKTLVAENERLKVKNTELAADNRRLEMLGAELLRTNPPINRTPTVDAQIRRMLADQEKAHASLIAQTDSVRHGAKIFIALLAVVAAMPYLIRLISLL